MGSIFWGDHTVLDRGRNQKKNLKGLSYKINRLFEDLWIALLPLQYQLSLHGFVFSGPKFEKFTPRQLLRSQESCISPNALGYYNNMPKSWIQKDRYVVAF